MAIFKGVLIPDSSMTLFDTVSGAVLSSVSVSGQELIDQHQRGECSSFCSLCDLESRLEGRDAELL